MRFMDSHFKVRSLFSSTVFLLMFFSVPSPFMLIKALVGLDPRFVGNGETTLPEPGQNQIVTHL